MSINQTLAAEAAPELIMTKGDRCTGKCQVTRKGSGTRVSADEPYSLDRIFQDVDRVVRATAEVRRELRVAKAPAEDFLW